MMAFGATQYMPRDRNLPGMQPNVGEAFSAILKAIWPYHTAKQAARAFDFKPETAESAVKAHVSTQSLTKAIQVQQAKSRDAWLLWKALGAQIIGETLEEYETRAVQAMLKEAERAAANVQSLHDQRRRLEGVALAALGSGVAAAPERVGNGGARRKADGTRR